MKTIISVERKLKKPFIPFTVKVEVEVNSFSQADYFLTRDDPFDFDDLECDMQEAIRDELLNQGLVENDGKKLKRKRKSDIINL